MRIHATFAWLEAAEGPSLVHAWDDYDVDENPDGYREDLQRTLARQQLAIDTQPHTVLIAVDYNAIERLFLEKPELEGTLVLDPPNAEEQAHE